ncbi:ATP-binding protein [Kitasatospora sp. RB6PN24]|uniref:ATP-binding protein n=1 Tax=Kitasatospora humi TaxID=2893891 RepID=UPI001E33D1E4|nr:ATP-binding protein [Kitasatospora humi]MCC9311239.1 ATP-binding protein [Kitasatospora humi]
MPEQCTLSPNCCWESPAASRWNFNSAPKYRQSNFTSLTVAAFLNNLTVGKRLLACRHRLPSSWRGKPATIGHRATGEAPPCPKPLPNHPQEGRIRNAGCRAATGPPPERAALRELLSRVKNGERFADRGELLLSELVTNAVVHGKPDGTRILVKLAVRDDVLRVEVHDRIEGTPLPRQAAADAMSGRGLCLVDSLALRWGCGPRGDGYLGKVVWCETAPEDE